MKKTITLLLIVFLISATYCQNQTSNETFTNMTAGEKPFFDTQGPEMTTLTTLIIMVAVYVLGKIAFRFLKWGIIITLIVLIFQILL